MNINNKILELSSEQVANRRNIKWVICQLEVENGNGCVFTEQYVNDNIESARNMLLYAVFADEEKSLYTDHGEEATTDGDYSFPNTSIVGVTTNAYISELTINGVIGKYFIGEGYLQEDKVPNFIAQLKEELDSGNAPKTSVEIHAKAGYSNIVYESGKWTTNNRKPMIFDWNGDCFVINPSDKNAILLELNSLKEKDNNKKEVKPNLKKSKITKKVELNELSIDDIRSIIRDKFNETMCPSDWNKDWEYDEYWVYVMYATRAILQSWEDSSIYYSISYSIDGNGEVVLGEAVRVEPAWNAITSDPNDDENEAPIKVDMSALKAAVNNKVEKNSCKKQENNSNKGGTSKMDEAKIQELNTKIDELTNKVAELNSAIVEANKALETEKADKVTMTEELNSLKAFKEEKDLEAKKAEINSYFESEVKKNGFSDVELNSLKTDYVDKMDLKGLKNAESELCVKKVKELNAIQKSVETNSADNSDLFMAIHNTEKSDEDISDLF